MSLLLEVIFYISDERSVKTFFLEAIFIEFCKQAAQFERTWEYISMECLCMYFSFRAGKANILFGNHRLKNTPVRKQFAYCAAPRN